MDQCITSPGAVVSILYIGHADGGIADPVVDHGIHRHRHAVLGQHLDIVKLWSGSKPCHLYLYVRTSIGCTYTCFQVQTKELAFLEPFSCVGSSLSIKEIDLKS